MRDGLRGGAAQVLTKDSMGLTSCSGQVLPLSIASCVGERPTSTIILWCVLYSRIRSGIIYRRGRVLVNSIYSNQQTIHNKPYQEITEPKVCSVIPRDSGEGRVGVSH